jgi:hypothetical protein
MKDTTMATKLESVPTKSSDRNGLLPSVVHLALDVADRSQSTAVAVLQDARIELRSAVDSTIDLAEKVTAAVIRFARKSVGRVDEASADALTGVNTVLTSAVKSARDTTLAAKELATTATAGVTGHASA